MGSLGIAAWILVAGAWAGTPKASSELKDTAGTKHTAAQAFDGLLDTGWAEGDMGPGTGSWIELALDGPTDVQSISLWPGNLSLGERSAREYGRPRLIKVSLLDTGGEPVVVDVTVLDPGERGPLRTDVDIAGTARRIRIDVVEAREGGVFNDMFIAEVAVNFVKGDAPKSVEKLTAWQDSAAGKDAAEKNRVEVVALYEKVKSEAEGYTDAFKELMTRAGEGAPYLRKQVLALAPAGFRVLALPPDDVAVDALLKIKDSNAIPAIERAALRSRGTEARKLLGQVEVFRAYQDLVGGGRFNIPPYGSTGWEKGALQGFGEPLPIEIDAWGNVYVADVANHRVQRFDTQGVVQQQWGHAEAGITNTWYTDSKRTHYVAGSLPGTGAGEFSTPVALARIPGKEGDSLAVLDAKGRVSVIDADGKLTPLVTLPFEDGLVPGVGGEGHLEYSPKGGGRFISIWGNEGWVHDATGAELGHFELEDGSPTGSMLLKNGKLALIYGKQLVMYSLDGYRHGDLMNGVLGGGFEAWDITVDLEGKVWVVTDKGWLYKLKKPGVIDFGVQVAETSLDAPRVAVIDGMAFITDRDAILRVDALELRASQDLAAAEASTAE